MIIRIAESADGGYTYDIWEKEEELEDAEDKDPDDGGVFDGTLKETIDDACDTAKNLIKP